MGDEPVHDPIGVVMFATGFCAAQAARGSVTCAPVETETGFGDTLTLPVTESWVPLVGQVWSGALLFWQS
jgi:hypothetical protein